ncbi:hypothetical protein C9J51_10480 [Photobacterium iliopiscarium]|nr:hypothetical protein C9I85_10455 [Photobacterium iliopiscarium]PSV82952.1 hypothetical protein C9J51_10480 [Photobacterium iliopiscarium]
MFYCCETGFFTFKTEVNGMWLLLSQCVVVFMLEIYGCPQFAPQFDNECLLFKQLSCDFKKTWLSFVLLPLCFFCALFRQKKPLNFYQLETKRRED